MEYKQVFLFVLASIAVIQCAPTGVLQKSSVAEPTCDRVRAIESTLQCWTSTEQADWFLENVDPDLKATLEQVDWETYFQMAENSNFSFALNFLVGELGGKEVVGVGLLFLLEEAVYAEDGPTVRGKICEAANLLLDCVSQHAAKCFPLIRSDLEKIAWENLVVLPNNPVQRILTLAKDAVCTFCENKGAGLKELISMFYDDKRNALLRNIFNVPEVRLKSYNSCPIKEEQDRPFPTNSEGYRFLLAGQTCEFLPFARCFTLDVYSKLQIVGTNYLTELVELIAMDAFSCKDANPPTSAICKFEASALLMESGSIKFEPSNVIIILLTFLPILMLVCPRL